MTHPGPRARDTGLKLGAQARAAGYRLEHFDVLGSSNDLAMERARAGDPGNLWIVCGEQQGGRGRHGRPWSSPRGNLYASLLLIDVAAPGHAPELGFVAGVALAQAANALAGGQGPFRIKWPNDLVHEGAKLSGLLLEGGVLADGRFACVMGFGVNCASHPEGLAYKTSDLGAVLGRSVAPGEMLEALSDCLVAALATWKGAGGFEAIRRAWLKDAAGLGTIVRANTGASVQEGRFETIDARGRLVLETSSGRVLIEAGDVFL